MSKIVFIQFGETRQLELKVDGDQTWMGITDEFISFLQGCGYQVTGKDVADYLDEVHGSYDLGDTFEYSTDTDALFAEPSGDVTLDDVMSMWGTTPVTQPSFDYDTITITTK